ncbi:MAG: sulfatase, partial [Pirellulales bacterium]|nr:sulfatase [Pirellulales bacterium]
MKNLLSAVLASLTLASLALAAKPDRPNILWITSEDNSIEWVSCYGSKNCRTPTIDKLASEGFRYTHCFDNAAVCAPTRSTWITGMYAISNGTQPMRSRNAIPHDKIKYYPDLLRKAGYHTSNDRKTDYNIGGRNDKDCWDLSGVRNAWRKRKPGQPFFAVVNFTSSHESRAHGSVEKTRNDPAKMTLASYHPDLPAIRKTYAKYADAVERMDSEIAATLAELKNDGLYDDAIIIYNSDHGGVLPRSKRFLYSSGTHCPLVVRIPEKYKDIWPADKPGSTVDRIVSFVDMPKTWLSLAGAEIPDTFQGTVFLGK